MTSGLGYFPIFSQECKVLSGTEAKKEETLKAHNDLRIKWDGIPVHCRREYKGLMHIDSGNNISVRDCWQTEMRLVALP